MFTDFLLGSKAPSPLKEYGLFPVVATVDLMVSWIASVQNGQPVTVIVTVMVTDPCNHKIDRRVHRDRTNEKLSM